MDSDLDISSIIATHFFIIVIFAAWITPLIMAVGKNNNKMGKKGGKKKAVDPFSRKEWYDIKAPSMFTNRQVGKTLINRTQGTKIASEGLKGRVFEVSLADLNGSEADFRKFKLVAEDVQGKNVLTNFHAMSMTRDKLCSIVKKWHVSNCWPYFAYILIFRPLSRLMLPSRPPMVTSSEFSALVSPARVPTR